MFGVQRFHSYLYGRQFTLYTDHKPLESLFNPRKSISTMVSQRIQRWALTLAMYEYTVKHRPGDANSNADALSHLPMPDVPDVTPVPPEIVLMLEQIDSSPITVSQIHTWTRRDPILSQVHRYIQNGWPSTVPPEFRPVLTKKDEFSIVDNCLLW